MFQDMMDRIEDETIRYFYFMRIQTGNVPLPYPEAEEEEDEEELERQREISAAQLEDRKREAQQSVLDLTRNIHRKKDRESAELQFTGGDGNTASSPKTVNKGAKVGRNELCPCGSGKKYKKCHGAPAHV
jgi:preprotein translocase subunit SecA